MAATLWKTIPCKISELRLDRTLACGQSFRWKEYTPGIWTGIIGDAVWQLKQTDTHIWYKVHKHIAEDIKVKPDLVKCEYGSKSRECASSKQNERKCRKISNNLVVKSEPIDDADKNGTVVVQNYPDVTALTAPEIKEDENILVDYFQLSIKLEELYKFWAKVDGHFEQVSKEFTGIRMLRQNPVECLFSFICSSNNHITRISSMVEKLARHYGTRINLPYCVDGTDFYTFPKISALASPEVEEQLRELGFGYRAKYIQKSACYLEDNGGEAWLYQLRDMEYIEAKKNLIKLCGVGAKVADCVLLMCLDQPGSIPVDTHVWQIAARDYIPKLKHTKSLTDKLYDEIGDYFRNLWGPYAGWAHSVLFTADLKKFKDIKEVNEKKPMKRKIEGKIQTLKEGVKSGKKKSR